MNENTVVSIAGSPADLKRIFAGERITSAYEEYLHENRVAPARFDEEYYSSRAFAPGAKCLLASPGGGGTPGVSAILSYNDFDSSAFEKKCGRFDMFARSAGALPEFVHSAVEKFAETAAADGYSFLSARIGGADFVLADALVRNGFDSVDELDIFWMKKRGPAGPDARPSGGIAIETVSGLAAGNDAERAAIRAIARETFVKSRFYNDRRVEKAAADEFYDRLAGAFLETAGSVNIVARIGGEVAGFVTGVPNDRISELSKTRFIYLYLIAVGSSFQGAGVGDALVAAFVDKCFGLGYDVIEVGTQSFNYRAAALYERHGFRKCSYLKTFHRHF